MYEVLDAFETPDDGTGASLQTLELATSLFDRYMASLAQPFMDRENLEPCAWRAYPGPSSKVQSYLVTDSYYLANEAERNHVGRNPAYSRPSNGTFAEEFLGGRCL